MSQFSAMLYAFPPDSLRLSIHFDQVGGAPKAQRRRRAEKRSSKRIFWRVRFFSAPFAFSGALKANLKGAEKKRTLQKHPFGRPFLRTTPSPLLWRALTSFCHFQGACNNNKISRRLNLHFQDCIVMAFPERNSIFGRFPSQILFLLSSRRL